VPNRDVAGTMLLWLKSTQCMPFTGGVFDDAHTARH
jgi:hypothetical protein